MNFLVCTDGSPASLAILPHAGRLARALDAELVLFRVLDERVDAAAEVSSRLEDAVQRVEGRWKTELAESLDRERVPGRAMIGRREWGKDVADAIRAAADDSDSALVAISSRGAGAMRHALLGSVALGVIGRTSVPVMTMAGVHPPRSGSSPYHVVITSDGSPDSRSVFAGVHQLLVPGRTKVTLLEIVTMLAQEREDEAKARVRPYLESQLSRLPAEIEADIAMDAVPVNSRIDLAIVAMARGLGADAIASATHGHTAFRHLVAGSTALGVVEKAGMPVILVKSSPME